MLECHLHSRKLSFCSPRTTSVSTSAPKSTLTIIAIGQTYQGKPEDRWFALVHAASVCFHVLIQQSRNCIANSTWPFAVVAFVCFWTVKGGQSEFHCQRWSCAWISFSIVSHQWPLSLVPISSQSGKRTSRPIIRTRDQEPWVEISYHRGRHSLFSPEGPTTISLSIYLSPRDPQGGLARYPARFLCLFSFSTTMPSPLH